MKRFFAGLCLLLAASCATISAQASSQPEEDVKQVVANFADAWNKHDVPAMVALHTANVNFTNIGGEWLKGKDEVSAKLQQVHATIFAKSTMTIHTDQVRFLTDKIAVVHGTMELHNVPPGAQGECSSIRVLVYQDGKWLIDDFQNTMIRQPGAK